MSTRPDVGLVSKFLNGGIPFLIQEGVHYSDVRDMADVLARARGLDSSRRVFHQCGTLCTVETFFADLNRLSGRAAPRLKPPWRLAWLAAMLDHHGGRLLLKRPLGSIPDLVVVEMGSHYWNTRSRYARKDVNCALRPDTETLRDTIEWLVQHGGVTQSWS